MKIAIIPNFTKKDTYEVTLALYNELLRIGVKPLFEKEHYDLLSYCSKAEFIESPQLYKDCDWVMAIGGDGSIIYAAKNAAINNKPILGVNTGYLAFMAGLEKNQINALKQLIDGEYKLEKRLVLKTEIIENEKIISTNYCINDAVFARGNDMRPMKIVLECNGNRVNEFHADGVVIATPTGSTAYSLSAGGSVADPAAECILMTPVANHSLMSRPMIFCSDSVLCAYPSENSPNPIFLSFDGDKGIKMDKNIKAIISKADFTVDFIRAKNYTFWNTLYAKLFRS